MYGKYGNPNYEGVEKEVRINNCQNYITGVGADSQNASKSSATCTTNTYETIDGQTASTTGNITGIYDMSGGSNEYVMGNLNKTIDESGFSSFPEDKYYNLYKNANVSIACDNGVCYGEALSETQNWYYDSEEFVHVNSNPFLLRGGLFSGGNMSGIFNFYHGGLGGVVDRSTRPVQVPLK